MYVAMKTVFKREPETFKQVALGAFCKRRNAQAAAEREFDREIEKMEASGTRPFEIVDDNSYEICSEDENTQVHIEVLEVEELD